MCLQANDLATVGMSDVKIQRMIDQLRHLDGPFAPGANNRQLILDLYNRSEVAMYQRVWLDHGQLSKVWLESEDQDASLWQRIVGLRSTQLEPSPDSSGRFLGVETLPLLVEVAPIKNALVAARTTLGMALQPAALTVDDEDESAHEMLIEGEADGAVSPQEALSLRAEGSSRLVPHCLPHHLSLGPSDGRSVYCIVASSFDDGSKSESTETSIQDLHWHQRCGRAQKSHSAIGGCCRAHAAVQVSRASLTYLAVFIFSMCCSCSSLLKDGRGRAAAGDLHLPDDGAGLRHAQIALQTAHGTVQDHPGSQDVAGARGRGAWLQLFFFFSRHWSPLPLPRISGPSPSPLLLTAFCIST